MFVKLAIASLLALATAAPQHQQPAQFPAGVNPALCPGFPICDNALLHNPQSQQHWGAQPHAAAHWNHQPAAHHDQWNNHGAQNHWDSEPNWDAEPHTNWNAEPHTNWNAPALHAPASNHLPEAEKYPAGVNPHTCPNYPFCDVNAGHNHGAAPPLPGFTERLYPAGVSPHSCPNFPYCN